MAWQTASTKLAGWPARSARAGRASQVMIGPAFALADVVQQGRGAHHGQIGALRRGDALGQRGHAQHMLEVVPAAGILVQGAGSFDGDGERIGHGMA